MKQGIAWVLLVTDNYDQSYSFYKEVLEFPIEREIKEEQFCQFALPHCFLAIYGRNQVQKLFKDHQLGKPGAAIYSFPDSEDIDADYIKLRGKGVQFIQEPLTQPWQQRTAYFTDPDGHIWELQQWLNK